MSNPIQDILDDTQHYYRRNVYGSWVYDHLHHRQLSGQIKKALIGYAKPWTTMRYLLSRGHHVDDMVAAGVVRVGLNGQPMDVLVDRLTIPIVSPTDGNIIGFSGRVNPETSGDYPKYVNTPTTELFSKKDVLYIPPTARKHLAGLRPIIVEGALDALAIQQASGDTFSGLVGVAPCGTAFTAAQSKLIGQIFNPRLAPIVCFDSDPAGKAATVKAWTIAKQTPNPLSWKVLVLPDGTDPASLHQDGKLAALLTQVTNDDGIESVTRPLWEVAADALVPDGSLDHLGRRVAVAKHIASQVIDFSFVTAAHTMNVNDWLTRRLEISPQSAHHVTINTLFETSTEPAVGRNPLASFETTGIENRAGIEI